MKRLLTAQGNEVPQGRVGLGDIQALLSMLTGYLTYLRKAVPASPRRATQIRTLERLRRRLAALLASSRRGGEPPLWLTREEIPALKEGVSRVLPGERPHTPAPTLPDGPLP